MDIHPLYIQRFKTRDYMTYMTYIFPPAFRPVEKTFHFVGHVSHLKTNDLHDLHFHGALAKN